MGGTFLLLLGRPSGGRASAPAAAAGVQTVATDASATPTTAHTVMAGSRNALAVWAGDPYAASEPTWYLYVRVNGGTAAKVRMHPWQAQYVAVAAGGSVSLGTSDGRTVSFAQATYPGSLASPSGVTGTANCDKALPSGINSDIPLWQPSAGHVTLGSYNEVLQLNSDGTERWVFLREQDDAGTWTPIRAVLLQAAVNLRVQCTYKVVALANEAGAALSVTVNTGGTVGGTKTTMSTTFQPVTGATYNVSTVAELKTAIAAALYGDEIVLAAGTYALDVAITQTSFTANHGTVSAGYGRWGMEGITIRGATGTASDVVLTGNGTSTNGNWDVLVQQTVFASAGTAGFKDLKFNFSGIAAGLSMTGGRWRLQNVTATGPASTARDVISAARSEASYPIDFLALWCDASNGGSTEDCWNFGGAGVANNSLAKLVGCTGSVGDAAASQSQVVTSHNGFPLEVYGGTFSDANTNVFAPDANTTPQYFFFGTVTPGSHNSGVTNTDCYGCNITLSSGTNLLNTRTSGFVMFCKITGASFAASSPVFRSTSATTMPSGLTLSHNRVTATNGRCYFPSVGGGAAFTWNIVSGFGEGVRYDGYSAGSTANTTFHSNTFKSCTIALNLDDSSMLWTMKNNACKTSGTSINCTATSMGLGTTNYNVLDPVVDTDFVAGANDTTGSDAALDSADFPTASGNCDGNGDTSLVDWVGGSDPFGFALVYKSARVSRGARDIAAIYSGAAVYPPVW